MFFSSPGFLISHAYKLNKQEYIMRNAGLEETKAGIKIAGISEISITSDRDV